MLQPALPKCARKAGTLRAGGFTGCVTEKIRSWPERAPGCMRAKRSARGRTLAHLAAAFWPHLLVRKSVFFYDMMMTAESWRYENAAQSCSRIILFTMLEFPY